MPTPIGGMQTEGFARRPYTAPCRWGRRIPPIGPPPPTHPPAASKRRKAGAAGGDEGQQADQPAKALEDMSIDEFLAGGFLEAQPPAGGGGGAGPPSDDGEPPWKIKWKAVCLCVQLYVCTVNRLLIAACIAPHVALLQTMSCWTAMRR